MFEDLREKCNLICDYLYDKYPNTKETAKENLQIQKMDGRNITVERIDDEHFAVGTAITGEAEQKVKNHEKKEAYKQELHSLMEKCNISAEGTPNYETINDTIDFILKISDERLDARFELERFLFALMCVVLKNESTSDDRREYLCGIWLTKIEGVFNGHYPVVDAETVRILFEQIYSSVSDGIKNRIKLFILNCIRYSGNDGIVNKYTKYAVQFLNTDNNTAHSFFYTILLLSNQNCQQREKEIIEQYLFNKKIPQQLRLLSKQFDFDILISVTNCGLDLNDDSFCKVFILILQMLDDDLKKNRSASNLYNINKIVCYIQQQIQKRSSYKKAIDILFDNIDFENATKKTIDLYDDIFSYNLPAYFDGHTNAQIRLDIQNVLEYLENRINSIDNQSIKVELYKALILSSTRYDCGDWSKLKTKYSYIDKIYLNNQLIKYGKYHFAAALYSLFQLQFEELLPEILVGISYALNDLSRNIDEFYYMMQNKNNKYFMEQLILVAFLKFSDKIKGEKEYCDAFESILSNLISIGNEKAAVILDEFRIH